jgi:hypothetical protein
MSPTTCDAFERLCCDLEIADGALMPMLTAFLDDSGTHPKSEVAVVAGFISSKLLWDGFRKEWRRTLRKHGVDSFHATDLENSKKQFIGWSRPQSEALRRDLYEIVRRKTLIPIGCATIVSDWERLMPQHIKAEMGGAYGWCAEQCLHEVARWTKHAHRPETEFRYVFGAGTKGHGQVAKMLTEVTTQPRYAWLGVESYSFEKKAMTPLQAADWMAYEVYKHMCNQVVHNTHPMRPSFALLIGKKPPSYITYYNAQRLNELINLALKIED